jgi:hypothetical protein
VKVLLVVRGSEARDHQNIDAVELGDCRTQQNEWAAAAFFET